MAISALFDFRDASLSGDPKWARTSPHFARYAPLVVLTLAVLSIVEVVIGIVWITSIQSLSNGYGNNGLTFPQVIQPLIVPALSFFNTIPSLHLHVLARSNHPILAMVFSSVLSVIFLGSAVVFLPPCVGGNAAGTFGTPDGRIVGSYQRTECPAGSRRATWATMVALQFVSAVLYALHFAMALKVWRGVKIRERAIAGGDLVEMEDEEEKARREKVVSQVTEGVGPP